MFSPRALEAEGWRVDTETQARYAGVAEYLNKAPQPLMAYKRNSPTFTETLSWKPSENPICSYRRELRSQEGLLSMQVRTLGEKGEQLDSHPSITQLNVGEIHLIYSQTIHMRYAPELRIYTQPIDSRGHLAHWDKVNSALRRLGLPDNFLNPSPIDTLDVLDRLVFPSRRDQTSLN